MRESISTTDPRISRSSFARIVRVGRSNGDLPAGFDDPDGQEAYVRGFVDAWLVKRAGRILTSISEPLIVDDYVRVPVQKPARTESFYQQKIRSLVRTDVDPRHVEAWMRVEHPTLDGLSPTEFATDVAAAVECVYQMGRIASETLAETFGL